MTDKKTREKFAFKTSKVKILEVVLVDKSKVLIRWCVSVAVKRQRRVFLFLVTFVFSFGRVFLGNSRVAMFAHSSSSIAVVR